MAIAAQRRLAPLPIQPQLSLELFGRLLDRVGAALLLVGLDGLEVVVGVGEFVLERLDRQVILVLLFERRLRVVANGVLRAQLGLPRLVLPSVGCLVGLWVWV